MLRWGDRIVAWYLREHDLRGYVPGKGWAHAVAHGADAIAALAGSRHFGVPELTVLLDVLADRLLIPVDGLLPSGEPDRMAAAVMAVLRRNLVPLKVVEPWIARLAAGRQPDGDPRRPRPVPRDQQRRSSCSAVALPAARAGPAARPPTGRPDPGHRRRAARHQPVHPALTADGADYR